MTLNRTALREACEAWDHGGTLSLGLWLSRYKPRFSVADYGALVQLVRDELGDDTDYSKEWCYVLFNVGRPGPEEERRAQGERGDDAVRGALRDGAERGAGEGAGRVVAGAD